MSGKVSLHYVPKCLPTSSEDVRKFQEFIDRCSKMFIITGAGISTESGIPDYRSEGVGLYARSNHRPMRIQEFLSSAESRKRYWARNFVGWPRFSSSSPNINHHTIRNWELSGRLHCLVTQNVDGLHQKAGSHSAIELHGTAFLVRCLSCDYIVGRQEFQRRLEFLNPFMSPVWRKTDTYLSTTEVRPDGDIDLVEADVKNFIVPNCPLCSKGILQPNIVFFGDNVKKEKVDDIYGQLGRCDSVLVLGSSLQVFSSYRFVLRAKELEIPIAIATLGNTRADKFAVLKISSRLGDILPQIRLL